jgi:hypothetical protein
MKTNKQLIIIISLVLVITLTNFSYAISNESIQASGKLNQAEEAIKEMAELGISITRVNETYYGAKQIYEAQVALERIRKKTDYRLVIEYTNEITSIKKIAIQASDELKVFIEFHNESSGRADLSEMKEEYNLVITSFEDERFEETIELVKQGYDRISEIEASQTAINTFRATTSRTLKNFFKDNWIKLLIGLGVAIVLLLVFKTSIKIILIRRKKKFLKLRKATIQDLIKGIQKEYFKDTKISRLQYQTRLNKFEEMIRDINRELPLLDEKMSAIEYRGKIKTFKKSKKNKKSGT